MLRPIREFYSAKKALMNELFPSSSNKLVMYTHSLFVSSKLPRLVSTRNNWEDALFVSAVYIKVVKVYHDFSEMRCPMFKHAKSLVHRIATKRKK